MLQIQLHLRGITIHSYTISMYKRLQFMGGLLLIKQPFSVRCHTFWGLVETVCLCRSLCKASFSICIALTTAETERSGSFSHSFFRVAESGLSGRLDGPAPPKKEGIFMFPGIQVWNITTTYFWNIRFSHWHRALLAVCNQSKEGWIATICFYIKMPGHIYFRQQLKQ